MRCRCAALLRVSTDKQSLDSQRAATQAWAEREGAELAVYEEEAVSGAARRRPVLEHVLEDARRGRFQILVVSALDRLARDVVRLVLTLDELHAAGVRVVSLREGLDFGGAMGRAMASLLGAIAEIERAAIVDRIRAGMRAAKARGKRIGRPRYVVGDQELDEMLELRRRGASVREIARTVRVFDQNGRACRPSVGWVHRTISEACSERGPENQVDGRRQVAACGAPPRCSGTTSFLNSTPEDVEEQPGEETPQERCNDSERGPSHG